jgi:hypothetical protein
MSERERKAFFFPHPLAPGCGPTALPGRVPFDVTAVLLPRNGEPNEDSAVVMADGYARNVVGPNQDPCVFSRPIGPFHTFCRIGSTKPAHLVRGTNLRLPQAVTTGDVIVYGNHFSPPGTSSIERIWIDAVIVVEYVPCWPTCAKALGYSCRSTSCPKRHFVLSDPRAFAASITGQRGATDAYRFNISDAELSGTHCCTDVCDYKVILGRVVRAARAADQLETSFCTLAVPEPDGNWWPAFVGVDDVDPTIWTRWVEFLQRDVQCPVSDGWIAEFPTFDLAESLVRAVMQRSGGAVALPPLTPSVPLSRWDPRSLSLSPP